MGLTFCVSICLFVAASQAKADAELDKFQGSWQVEKASSGGTEAPAANVAMMVITFKDDQAIPKENPKDIAKVKLDANKKPAEIDLTDKDNKTNKGIYRFIDKDALEICMNLTEDAARPKDFISPKGSTVIIMVMKRVKN
jgi:uncharacterized protein (TIGR03067 family)